MGRAVAALGLVSLDCGSGTFVWFRDHRYHRQARLRKCLFVFKDSLITLALGGLEITM